jgi:hypothetical protein
MKVNKKASKIILLIICICVILFLFHYFVFFLPAYSSICTTFYIQNKTALITAFVEDYKKNAGHPPDDMTEIQGRIEDYLLNNADFHNKFLFSAWTDQKIPLLMMPALAKGYKIKYSKLRYFRDGDDYYLYFWIRDNQQKNLTLKEVKEILSKYRGFSAKYSGLAVVHNGKIAFGMVSKNDEPFTLDNINAYLKPAMRQKTFMWYLVK